MRIEGVEVAVAGGVVRTARLEDEWYRDLDNPPGFIDALKKARVGADIFTFWQRLPETEQKYAYHAEVQSIAAMPILSFSHWWEKQVDPKTRNMIRKAEKKGVEVREAEFDEHFIDGMTKIFNESPTRQGRPFWHYGKSRETVRQEFSRYLFREDLIGAYYDGELIGFIMLANAGKYGDITQIIASLNHRDKSPMNALVAKAVSLCEKKQLPYLVYASWLTTSLGDFKRHNGFQRFDLPRYYVPLTLRGRLALSLHLHHGVKALIPERAVAVAKGWRSKWYARRSEAP